MHTPLNVLLAQINPVVGAITTNTDCIISIIERYQDSHDLILFPELALSGYPPEDLLSRNDFYPAVEQALARIQSVVADCHVILGHPSRSTDLHHNSASVFHQNQCIMVYHKQHLPNKGVFDEKRYFSPGNRQDLIFTVKGHHLGLCICEDVWRHGPVEHLKAAGATTLLCLNASPFDDEKYQQREIILKNHAKKGLNILYVNQTGGQDELVFDGLSLAIDHQGKIGARAPAFEECMLSVSLQEEKIIGEISLMPHQETLIYQALLCGIKDYVHKNGFKGVLLGLSGGIDSALTLALAADALGPENVQAVLMPSRYTASMSVEDAIKQAQTMGVPYTLMSIENAFDALIETLAPAFQGLQPDTTEENIQARIRGLLLMALSNKQGKMVLCTSNKSETAVGYSTLYGDMVGALAPLKDVLKTEVYALANYRNAINPVIPERVITRPPSAELRHNQTDQDSLPDYAILDAIIKAYMINNASPAELVAQGFDKHTVDTVIERIIRNEYKRRQSAPGIKISSKAFGRDWRYPLTRGSW